jgi:excisionase family DNA binding protein
MSLQSSTRTVRRLISSGELSTVRIGRLVRIRPDVFAALLDQRTGCDRSGK